MDNSPLDRGLALTLSWCARGERRRRSLPLGSLLRVGLGLALCAACYQAGRWHGGLEAQAERTPLRPRLSARISKTLPIAEPLAGTAAPGQVVGEPQEVITPLNVRDASALVMGPSEYALPAARREPRPSAPELEADAPPSAPPARVFPRPSAKVKPDPRF